MVSRCPIAGAGRRAIAPRARPCGLAARSLCRDLLRRRRLLPYVGRNYDEAIRLSREALRHRSDFVGAHRVLTAAVGMAGQRDLAKAALEELRRAQPEYLAGLARQRNAVRARGRIGSIIWRGFGGRGWGRREGRACAVKLFP